ncbi:MAG: hypothetical protein WCP17_03495 [bacterium]
MEQNFQTSFIPKKPIVDERVSYARPVGILVMASFFILVTVLLVTGGLYIYEGVLNSNIKKKDASLTLAEKDFELPQIAELQLLDKRLRASTEILSKHIVVTPIFKVLEEVTRKTIRYTKFSYELSTDKTTKITIKMSGQARGYRDIALQADILSANDKASKNFIDPIFSNLTLDNGGNVLFDLEFLVEPSFVDYKQTLLTES